MAGLVLQPSHAVTVTKDVMQVILPPGVDVPVDPAHPEEGTIPADAATPLYIRGEFSNKGDHPLLGQTFIGQSGNTLDSIYAGYLGFDLSDLVGKTALSAKLRIELEDYFGPKPFEDFTINDVSTSSAGLFLTSYLKDPFAQQVYADLSTSSGDVYGKGRFFSGQVGTTLEITLGGSAVRDINLLLSGALPAQFYVGLSLDQTAFQTGQQEGLRFGEGNEARPHQLLLQFAPVPDTASTLTLAAAASISLIAIRYAQNRRNPRER